MTALNQKKLKNKEIDFLLVDRFLQGDVGAFNELYERHLPRVQRIVKLFLRSQDEVEEIAHEALIKAYKGLPTFRKESAFATWLYRVAVNCAKNHLDKKRIERNRLISLDKLENVENFTIFTCLDDPSNECATDEVKAILKNSIANLTSDLRAVLLLREVEQLSYADIATKMDCPIGTVRSRLFRAREIVDRQIEEAMLSIY